MSSMLPEEKISNTNDTIQWLFVLLSDNAKTLYVISSSDTM